MLKEKDVISRAATFRALQEEVEDAGRNWAVCQAREAKDKAEAATLERKLGVVTAGLQRAELLAVRAATAKHAGGEGRRDRRL